MCIYIWSVYVKNGGGGGGKAMIGNELRVCNVKLFHVVDLSLHNNNIGINPMIGIILLSMISGDLLF